MFTAYCHSEGDVYFSEDGKDVPSGAIIIMKGYERLIRKIVKEFCVIGNFSGEKIPCIKAVNDIAMLSRDGTNPDQELQGDALRDWLIETKERYPDNGVFFTDFKY